MRYKKFINPVLAAVFIIFITVSFLLGYDPGKEIGVNFISFTWEMIKIVPVAFVLIGLFEAWVKKTTIEKHLGHESGFLGYVWAILLAGSTVGGLYVAFPAAYSLYGKGAKLSVVLTYLGAVAICRIPMTVFEASFLGVKFTVVRWLVSLPLIVISSMLLGDYLTRINYKIK